MILLSVLFTLLTVWGGGVVLRGQDYDRFASGGFRNGVLWITMNSEQKSSFLLGFEDGMRTGIGRAVHHKWLKGEQEDKLMAELLVRERPGLDVGAEIDRIYKDDANLRLPIMTVYEVVRLDLTPEGEHVALGILRKAATK